MNDFDEILTEANRKATPEFCDQLHKVLKAGEGTCVCLPMLGGMKAGKSTLLAKLLACEQTYLPPGVLEATARNVFVSWGFAANRKIERADGSETSVVEDAEWDALVRGTAGNLNDGERLVIDLPADVLSNGMISFVDTPGNNTIDDSKVIETWAALAGARLAVYCIRATAMLTKSDVAFLRTAIHKLPNFVIAVTRIDEAGISDVASAEAQSLVAYARQRVVEALGHEPLKVFAVSSKIPGEASGIPALGAFIVQTVRENGRRLRDERVRRDVSDLAEQTLPTARNELLLLQKSNEADAEEIQRKLGELQAKLAESEVDRDGSLRRLAADLDSRKVAVRGEVANAAHDAFERFKSRVGSIASADELEASSAGMLLSECEQLQGEIKQLLCREREDGRAILQNAASDFLQGLETSAREIVGGEFKVTLSDPEQYEVSPMFRDESIRLSAEGAKVAREIELLRGEISADENVLPELQHNLEVAQQEASAIRYEPKYVENPQANQPGRAETALAGIGEALDWALLFTPIPNNKLKWLGKLKYGSKISKVIKQTNKIVRAKNRMVNNITKTVPVIGPVLNLFSAESWLRKVGKMIDGPAQTPAMIEDEITRRAYEEAVATCNAKQRAISVEIVNAESELKEKNLELVRLQQYGESTEAARLEAERQLKERTNALTALRDEARLVEGRSQLIQRAAAIFALSSDFLRPIVEGIEQALSLAYEGMSKDLVSSMNATIETVRRQLADFDSYRAKNEEERGSQISVLHERIAFYQTLILEKQA